MHRRMGNGILTRRAQDAESPSPCPRRLPRAGHGSVQNLITFAAWTQVQAPSILAQGDEI